MLNEYQLGAEGDVSALYWNKCLYPSLSLCRMVVSMQRQFPHCLLKCSQFSMNLILESVGATSQRQVSSPESGPSILLIFHNGTLD